MNDIGTGVLEHFFGFSQCTGKRILRFYWSAIHLAIQERHIQKGVEMEMRVHLMESRINEHPCFKMRSTQ